MQNTQAGLSVGCGEGGQDIRKLEIRGLTTNSDLNSSPLSESLSQENKNLKCLELISGISKGK